MVNLIWKNKSDKTSNIEELKKFYSEFFKPFFLPPISKNDENLYNQEVNGWKNKLFWDENLSVLYHLLNKFEE